MANSNGQITAPVNTDDVSTVLGHASHDVKTLCMSAKINMWAKYKPEAQGNEKPLTLEQRQNNNFGLVPTATYSSKSDFINAVANGTFTGGWTYTRVGTNNWGRLGDFNGYNHNATNPFGNIMPITIILTNNSNVHTIIPMSAPDVDDSSINMSEFKKSGADYANWYLGVLLYHSTASKRLMATATATIGSGNDWQVDFGYLPPSAHTGTYKAVPFLSSKQFSVTGAEPAGVSIIGVGSTGVTVELKSTSQVYYAHASCYYANSTTLNVSYLVTLQNTTSTSYTFKNMTIEVAYNNQGTNSTVLVSLGNVTVESGKTVTKSGTKSVSSRNFQFFRLSYTGSTDMNWVNFEDVEEEPYDPM